MGFHRETLVAEDAPTPDQLFKLAAQGLIIAKRSDGVRIGTRKRGMILPTQVTIPYEIEALREYRYEQKWLCSIARTDFREWSMRLISRMHVIEVSQGLATEVQTYKFEWNREQTLLASRDIVVAPTTEQHLGDFVDKFQISEDMSDEWDWREQMAQMTAGDVSLLSKDFERIEGHPGLGDVSYNRVA